MVTNRISKTAVLAALVAVCVPSMGISGCHSKNKKQMETTNVQTKESTASTQQPDELAMLVGTYTTGSSKGIYSYRFNQEKGTATLLSETEVENPSYLVPSADGKRVYAVSELNNERASANAFAFDKETGKLQFLNSQPTGGEDPCHIITDKNSVITANYSGGSISVFPLDEEGALLPASDIVQFNGSGKDKERQDKAHLHFVQITPDGKYLLADDLGTDRIHLFGIGTTSKHRGIQLEKAHTVGFSVTPGSGPRHLAFASDGGHAYLLNELSGTVIAFEYRDGDLKEIQTIAADTVGGQGSADIHVSPDGKFLYASNRLKADGIAIFSIHPENGMLTKAGYQPTGIHPRNFIITPNGKYLLVACRDSHAIQVYERDPETGLLTDTRQDIKLDCPVCIRFVP